MVKKSIVVKLDQKADAMPIAMLVQVASQYESSIYVDADEKSQLNPTDRKETTAHRRDAAE